VGPAYHLPPGNSQEERRDLFVDGELFVSETLAHGLVDSGHRFQMRIWGDDPASDDRITGLFTPGLRGTPEAFQNPHLGTFFFTTHGLGFRIKAMVKRKQLNEDWGEDEIYAGVRLVNSDGTTIRDGHSNVVRRHW
jgi:hypothetical protein